MTTLREAAQQALEALEEYQEKGAPFWACDAAVAALRDALAQEDDPHPPSRHCMCEACKPAFEPTPGPEQEPVAWIHKLHYLLGHAENMPPADRALALGWEPLYTHPPRREWQGLTEEDIAQNLQSRLDAALLLEERRQEITQPRREWQGLTTQEAMALTDTAPKGVFYGCDAGIGLGIWIAAVAAAERALKEKNNG